MAQVIIFTNENGGQQVNCQLTKCKLNYGDIVDAAWIRNK